MGAHLKSKKASFLLYEEKTIQEIERLIILAEKYPELKNKAVELIKEHEKLSILYREGLYIYYNIYFTYGFFLVFS